jgi:hypothetical protein
MKPWMGWSLLALFLAALLVVQFIPADSGGDSDGRSTAEREDAPA